MGFSASWCLTIWDYLLVKEDAKPEVYTSHHFGPENSGISLWRGGSVLKFEKEHYPKALSHQTTADPSPAAFTGPQFPRGYHDARFSKVPAWEL